MSGLFVLDDCLNTPKQTALHWACLRGHIACVAVLLNAKADIERKDESGYSPLMLAVQQGGRAHLCVCVCVLFFFVSVVYLSLSLSCISFSPRGRPLPAHTLSVEPRCKRACRRLRGPHSVDVGCLPRPLQAPVVPGVPSILCNDAFFWRTFFQFLVDHVLTRLSCSSYRSVSST